MAAVRRGILGGTFDPVHLGHLALAQHAVEQLALTQVLWVPAGDPWRKADRAVTKAEQRVAMVKLAIAGNAAFAVCRLEVERPGPSYSVDTVAELRKEHPHDEWLLLLGLDALQDLPNWRDPERLLRMTTLAVVARGAEQPGAAELNRLYQGIGERVVWVEMPRIDISATELRRRAAEGRSLRYLVPDVVEAYIREKGLYRGA